MTLVAAEKLGDRSVEKTESEIEISNLVMLRTRIAYSHCVSDTDTGGYHKD